MRRQAERVRQRPAASDSDAARRKEHLDDLLNEALKETFPASDAIAVNGPDHPVGPISRAPAHSRRKRGQG